MHMQDHTTDPRRYIPTPIRRLLDSSLDSYTLCRIATAEAAAKHSETPSSYCLDDLIDWAVSAADAADRARVALEQLGGLAAAW